KLATRARVVPGPPGVAPRVRCRQPRRRNTRHDSDGGWRVRTDAACHGRRSQRRRCPSAEADWASAGRQAAVTALTIANHVTLLRMLLIPAFVILVLYGQLGWALTTFLIAGGTDALDGLIARRSGQHTTLGDWLDSMADKLLLLSAFIVLSLPDRGLTIRIPLWLT